MTRLIKESSPLASNITQGVNRLGPLKVYLDLPFIGALFSWVQDATLLWMVAQICNVRVKFYRYILGGAVGALFQFILLTNQVSGGILNAWILSPLVFLVLAPILIIYATFYPTNFRRLLRISGYFYLLAFLLSGLNWGLDSLNQRFLHWEISWWWRFWLHLSLIFILGELGWGVVHRRLWDQICLYPIRINWDGHELKLNALLDTGNRLHDPLTNVPVIIVELNELRRYLPEELLRIIEEFQCGDLGSGWNLPNPWGERFRLLPFNSIGKDHGMLVGFRPDQVSVWQKQREIISHNVVVGLYNRNLSREGTFHALIPPAVLQL